MPELPEVETVVLGLRDHLIDHRIEAVSYDWPKSLRLKPEALKRLKGAKIRAVGRRGKMILLHLSEDRTLVIHLKMTGQLVYKRADFSFGAGHPSASLIDKLPDKTTRVIFKLDGGGQLYFNDMRKFGWIQMTATKDLDNFKSIQALGPDALSISAADFVKIFKLKSKSVKACLLDQTLLAGCGNIYADEALWASKIHPRTPAKTLSEKTLKLLHKELQAVLKLSLEQGGSSSKNYINALGEKGKYLEFAKVYQRREEACFRCTSLIRRIEVAGRGTHICPVCQKEGRWSRF